MEDYTVQGSAAWLEWRRTKITGTDASVIKGVNPWENEYDLWKRKLGLLPPVQENEAMIRGRELEPLARKEFEAMTGIKMTPEVLVHDRLSWMVASLDGINESGTRILEIKCGGEDLHETTRRGETKQHYYAQFQHCLEVSGTDWGYFMSYRNGEGLILEIERDQAYIDELIAKEARFYQRLKEFDPPSPKHRKLETQEMLKAVDRYTVAKDMLSRAEKMEKEAREELLLLSGGDCIEGYGVKVTHYVQKGTVDYTAIPELKGVDLDKYRRPAQVRTRINVGE